MNTLRYIILHLSEGNDIEYSGVSDSDRNPHVDDCRIVESVLADTVAVDMILPETVLNGLPGRKLGEVVAHAMTQPGTPGFDAIIVGATIQEGVVWPYMQLTLDRPIFSPEFCAEQYRRHERSIIKGSTFAQDRNRRKHA